MIPAPRQISGAGRRKRVGVVSRPEVELSIFRPQEMMMSWCAQSGVPYLGLASELEKGNPDRVNFPYDAHGTAGGHLLAALSVVKVLSSNPPP